MIRTYPLCQLAGHFLPDHPHCVDKVDLDQGHTPRHTLLIPHQKDLGIFKVALLISSGM